MALSNKQQAFIEAYLGNGFNATKAAITAGYAERTARSAASRLLTNVNIAEAVKARIKALAMSADEALALLSEHARGNLGDFLGLSVEELIAHPQAYLLQEVERTQRIIPVKDGAPITEEKVKLKLYGAQPALIAILKEQHLNAGEATEIVDDARLTDDARVARINELLDAARARRDAAAHPADE